MQDKTYEMLTNSLQQNGINFKVTWKTQSEEDVETTVSLFDEVTGTTLGTTTENSVEAALTSLIGQLLGKYDRDLQLSRL